MKPKNLGVLMILMAAGAFLPLGISAQQAGSGMRPTDSELMALPPYCQARIRGDDSARKVWAQRIGPKNFSHLHHYCFGLNYMNRALSEFDTDERRRIYRRAVQQFDYVLKRWPPDFPLTSEALLQKQQAEAMQAY